MLFNIIILIISWLMLWMVVAAGGQRIFIRTEGCLKMAGRYPQRAGLFHKLSAGLNWSREISEAGGWLRWFC